MIKRILISVITPILLLWALAIFDIEIFHYLYAWPLMLLEQTGIIGNTPEGFYNRWYNASIIFSLLIQISALYYVLHKKSHNKQFNVDTGANAPPPVN